MIYTKRAIEPQSRAASSRFKSKEISDLMDSINLMQNSISTAYFYEHLYFACIYIHTHTHTQTICVKADRWVSAVDNVMPFFM